MEYICKYMNSLQNLSYNFYTVSGIVMELWQIMSLCEVLYMYYREGVSSETQSVKCDIGEVRHTGREIKEN